MHRKFEHTDFSQSLHLSFIRINSLASFLAKPGTLWGEVAIPDAFRELSAAVISSQPATTGSDVPNRMEPGEGSGLMNVI